MQKSNELAEGISSARLEIIEDCGLMAPLEAPEAVLALIRDWVEHAGI
ncbi:MAG: hypothetical protein VW268_06885 [Rhodospirillaceae bacterium]